SDPPRLQGDHRAPLLQRRPDLRRDLDQLTHATTLLLSCPRSPRRRGQLAHQPRGRPLQELPAGGKAVEGVARPGSRASSTPSRARPQAWACAGGTVSSASPWTTRTGPPYRRKASTGSKWSTSW